MNVNDLRVLAGAAFDAINDEAKKKGIEQVEIAVQYDIIGIGMEKLVGLTVGEPIVLTSPYDESPAWTARGKIVSAETVFYNTYQYNPSGNIMDYSSEACSDGPITTGGGIYIPIGVVLGGCPRVWYTEAGVGIGVETGNPDTDKDLAMSGARVVCDYFGKQGYSTPEVFHRKTVE